MRLKKFIPLLILFLLNLPGLCFSQSLKEGIDAIESGEYEKAVELITGVIDADDEFAEAFYYRGTAYNELEQYDKALEDFTAAIKLEPGNTSYLNFRGAIYYYEEQYDKALDDFTAAIVANPNDPLAYKNRANLNSELGNARAAKRDFAAYDRLVGGIFLDGPQDAIIKLSAGNYEGALKVLNKEIRRDNRNPALYHLRGVTYQGLEELQKAVNDFSAALTIDSTFHPAYQSRGNIFYDAGMLYNALEDYEAVERYGEANAELFRRRAWANSMIDSNTQALFDISTALDMDTASAGIYFTAGDVYRRMDSFQTSIDLYTEGIDLDENAVSVYRWRARSYNGLEQWENAVADFEKYLEKFEDNLDEQVNYATALGNAERYDKGIKTLEEVIAEDSTFYRAHYRMAMMYFDMEKFQTAVDWNLRYLEVIEPLNDKYMISNCYGSLAWKYLFIKDFVKAEESAREGLRYNSRNDWVNINLAVSMLYQGKYDEAFAIYDKFKEEEYGDGNYADTFIVDLDDLEEQGITHEDVAKIRAYLEPYLTDKEE